MKKILITVLLILGLASCSDYLDVNTNPNYPINAGNDMLIPSAQSIIASVVGGDMHNTGAFFAQYCDQLPESNQYNSLSEYSFKSSLFNRSYSNLYAGALKDLETVRIQASKSGEWGDYFVATVLRAYTLQVVVDYLDNAPYLEILQGNANPMPKWDSGKDIYAGILTELDEAQSKLTPLSLISADMVLEESVSNWIQFANALRLRIYMRSSNIQDNEAKIKALVQENNFFVGDVKFDAFSNDPNKRNPWYTVNKVELAANHAGAYPIISYLVATGDPRISDIFQKAAKSGNFAGMIPGSKTKLKENKNSSYSGLVYKAVMPVYYYTQSELQFFLAEAYLRYFNDDAKAKVAYEAGISANFKTRGLADGSSIYGPAGAVAWSRATTVDEKMELIGMQKWVALCMINNTESWTEVRRMGYPKLSTYTAEQIYNDPSLYTAGNLISPWVNALGDFKLVKSLYYPQTAVEVNKNTPAQRKITDLVWWNKK